MKKSYIFILSLFSFLFANSQNQNFIIDNSYPFEINEESLGNATIGGDTIFVSSTRTKPIKFKSLTGDEGSPIVIINKGGQVKIEDSDSYNWGAITFENCKYIKISGAGHSNYKYGFELVADQCGLAFTELSSDCEAEFIKVNHDGFFGIYAKKDYSGDPPTPHPVFENLVIHDCFIENVSEGMYLGETKTPGMEFKHVKIYNNIVKNTLRECIQIANMVEDVEIYNNTLINAGLDNLYAHTNVLQIGDNSVVNAYNNILVNAPSNGIIVFGKGDCIFTNNYISSTSGVFIDDRTVSDTLSPITFNQNYFKATIGNQVIKNYNENNFITAKDNIYDTDITFFLNESGNTENISVTNNALESIQEIEFTDPDNNDYSLTSANPIEYENIGAPGGPEYIESTPSQIIITSDMVTDLVSGGSVNSPLLLFDEQDTSIENDEHPTSASWKPAYTMNSSSYHVVVDLGAEYYISEIDLHDMHDVHNFTVEYVQDENWTTLFVDPCDSYITWSKNEADITTRYLRFSMYDNVYAAVNEIFIYGYLKETTADSQIVINSEMVVDMVDGGSVNSPILLFDEQDIDIDSGEKPTSDPWKPYYTNANAPYYAIIDLGKEYSISEIDLHDMNDVHDFTVEYGEPLNWTTLFVDSLDLYNTWSKHSVNITTRYLRLAMLDSPYAAVNEIIIYGSPIFNAYELDEIVGEEHLIITSSMVTDLVEGGSVNSPLFLFDEQDLYTESTEHPTSKSWKPDYTMKNTAYHVVLDLGKTYDITKINLHDMHNIYDFTVEYRDGTNWKTLFVDPCDSYNTWSINEVDVTTKYLRFSMYDNVYAAVNEIFIYGEPSVSTSAKPSITSNIEEFNSTESTLNIKSLRLYPNPVAEKLNIEFPLEMMGNNRLFIKNLRGRIIHAENLLVSENTSTKQLTNYQLPKTNGVYTISIMHESGIQKNLKFIKK
ncbi:Right handed beta helix region [Lutibacter oricola]|uniref:Right handed beta helix region n=1 Tax=Lutibacter oricola TaxID=762486 RepID=A0A1H2TMH1_9FLAO|nr:T9SS type A sorting domain-containing protein [Lutibacter oricola]SDW44955.1 Right handed beta helix region [Lutibacter oricola]SDW45030.1 Right handed beta helix region [Lutibacter oricola]